MNISLKTARTLLGNTKTLPVISSNAQSIFSKASDQFVGLKSLASSVETDPVISARIVGLANSSFYGQVNEITSLESAIIRVLGLDLTRGIIIGMVCSGIINASQVPNFDTERFWKSSIKSSVISSIIASHSTVLAEQLPLCSLAGMLLNIGLLAATVVAPNETQESLSDNNKDLATEMNRRLGCDHRHITTALAELWTLPSGIQEAFSRRSEIDWMSEQCLKECPPIQACIRLIDILKKEDDIECINKIPAIKLLLSNLGIQRQHAVISEILSKSDEDICEIASAIAKT